METQLQTHVFVYGTLKPGGYYHDAYCGEFQFEATDGTIMGRLYSFPSLSYPGAVENDTSRIKGVLIKFHHTEIEVLEKLDRLEGYDPDRTTDENEYYRKRISVFDENDRRIVAQAWCYFMDPEKIKRLKGVPVVTGFWPV